MTWLRPNGAGRGACCARANAPATAVDPFDIDAVLPLTGANAFVGNEQRQSFEILQADVNRGGGVRGRAIRFIIVDSQSNPQVAVQLTGPNPRQASGR